MKPQEELEALGQESEKEAVKDTVKVFKEKEKESSEKREKVLETLKQAPKTLQTYTQLLAKLLSQRMMVVDWPEGWKYEAFPTDEGVVFQMTNGKRNFQAGFKPTGQPHYDLNAIDTYALRAENTIDRIQNAPRGENV